MTFEVKDGGLAEGPLSFSDLSFLVRDHELCQVQVPSGCAELLIHAMLGLRPLSTGIVSLDGEPLTERSARAESLGEEEEGSHHGRGRDRKAGDRERRPRSEGGRPRDRRKRPEGSREGRNAQKGERRSRDNEGERNFRRERSERSSKNRPRRPRRDREHRNREDRHQEQGE